MDRTPIPYITCGATVYALNEAGTNRFFAQVQPGFVCGNRTTDEECEATAAFIFTACNAYDRDQEIIQQLRETARHLLALVDDCCECEHGFECARCTASNELRELLARLDGQK
jgi:hypothetical protein